MKMQTLVLSSSYEPVAIFDWKRAFNKILNKRAEIIADYTDRHLNSFEQAFKAPSIIRLLYFVSLPKNNTMFEPFTRKNIFIRDGGKCCYCDKKLKLSELHWDHIVPRDQGGKSNWQNICSCCLSCNLKKKNRTPAEAGMKLLRKPYAPHRKHSRREELVLKLKEIGNLPDKRWMDYIYYDIPLKD
jgi:5-methylcytosine-specific restriction endonuclease McrA